jgi:hypothetical protein
MKLFTAQLNELCDHSDTSKKFRPSKHRFSDPKFEFKKSALIV